MFLRVRMDSEQQCGRGIEAKFPRSRFHSTFSETENQGCSSLCGEEKELESEKE